MRSGRACYSLVSELVVARASDAELAGLTAWQRQLELMPTAGDVDAYFWHNVGFRAAEASLSGNNELQRRLSGLGLQMHRFRHLSLSLPGRLRHSVADHERLIRALPGPRHRPGLCGHPGRWC